MINSIVKFLNRKEGGQHLAALLMSKYGETHPLVLGIPKGGIEVAAEVACSLKASLSVVITKKLSHPNPPHVTIGAVAEDGSTFMNNNGNDLAADRIRLLVQAQIPELKSRVSRFRKGKLLPDMRNKTVIIVDDAIATGSTLVPAIKLCRAAKALKVIVATPVSSRNYVKEIDALADEVVVARQYDVLHAPREAYAEYGPVDEAAAQGFIERFSRFSAHTLQR